MKYAELTAFEKAILEKVKTRALDNSEPPSVLIKLRNEGFIYEHVIHGAVAYTVNNDKMPK
jgi:hypothetical protein